MSLNRKHTVGSLALAAATTRFLELVNEAKQLTALFPELGGLRTVRDTAADAKPKNVKKAKRVKVPRGERRRQILAFIDAFPGAPSWSDIATGLKHIPVGTVSGYLSHLRTQGVLVDGPDGGYMRPPASPSHVNGSAGEPVAVLA